MAEIIDYKHQEDCVKFLLDTIPTSENRSSAVTMGTGFGKTFVAAKFLKELQETDFWKGLIEQHNVIYPTFFITASSAVIQTKRVLNDFGVLKGCLVTNYDQLRASFGNVYIDWKTEVIGGQAVIVPRWDKEMRPHLIFWDECQKLKNDGTLQHNVARSFIEEYYGQAINIFLSATPFGKVGEAKCLTLASGLKVEGVMREKNRITSQTWPKFAKDISWPKAPLDNSPAAVRRLREILGDFIYVAKGVRFKKKTHIQCILTEFEKDEERQVYGKAYDDFIEELVLAGKNSDHGMMAYLVAQLKFRQKAELLKAPYLGKAGIETVKRGRQVIIGSNFVDSLLKVSEYLRRNGVPEEKISFIVGGQSKKERQANIDRFQKGEADYCLLTLRSGGVALSLHHDRPSTRPRSVILPPTWSGIELVQILGRGHRINSLSDTEQAIIWFAGTVEEDVSRLVEVKLSCLKEVVGRQETWSNAFAKKSHEDASNLSEAMNSSATESEDEDEESGPSVSVEEVEAMVA